METAKRILAPPVIDLAGLHKVIGECVEYHQRNGWRFQLLAMLIDKRLYVLRNLFVSSRACMQESMLDSQSRHLSYPIDMDSDNPITVKLFVLVGDFEA